MSSIPNEELDEIWNSAFDDENELVLRLVTEIGHVRKHAGKQARKLARVNASIRSIHNKHLRRGQESMRDRIVLTLLDAGRLDAATIANNHDIKREGTWQDLKKEHHANAAEMQRRRPILNDAWRRMFGETA